MAVGVIAKETYRDMHASLNEVSHQITSDVALRNKSSSGAGGAKHPEGTDSHSICERAGGAKRTGLRGWQTGIGKAHGQIPEIGNSRLETGPPIGPAQTHFRRSPISTAAKAGGMRAFAPVMTKSPISGNAWLTTQSRRTGLGSRITLVTGKILENRARGAESSPNYRSLISSLRREFPTPSNREFIRAEQGNRFCGTAIGAAPLAN